MNGDLEKKGVNAHDDSRSVRKNLWFSNSKSSTYDILHITKLWFGRRMFLCDYVVIE